MLDFETLITEVYNRPAIWDHKDPNHSNRDACANCWKEISEIMQFPVDGLKRKWKSLRDNFRLELRKVPSDKVNDPWLPMDQYLSKWPYFKMMFFLRDLMMEKKTSSSLLKGPDDLSLFRYEGYTMRHCCESPESLGKDNSISTLPITQEGQDFVDTREVRSYSTDSLSTVTAFGRKRKNSEDNLQHETMLDVERGRLEIEKRKLDIVIKNNEKREREENVADKHFLLSLLPLMRKVPLREKVSVQVKIQRLLYEAIYERDQPVSAESSIAAMYRL